MTMWSRAPLERQATNAVEAYNASHENQVDLQIIPNDDVEGKVGSAAQTDSLPDLLAGDVARVPYWTSEGIFMDTTDLINNLPNLDDLQSGHIEAGTIDDGLHTLPFVTDISEMDWNKDLYEEAGLDPEQGPTTVAEFVDQASPDAGVGELSVCGSCPAGLSADTGVYWQPHTSWACGGEPLTPDGTEADQHSDVTLLPRDGYHPPVEPDAGLRAGIPDEPDAAWTAPFQDGNIGVMPYPF